MYPQIVGRKQRWSHERAEIALLDCSDDHPLVGRFLIAIARICGVSVSE
ncbi:MAG: hypothetical protein KC729_08010 [Candidatus Eisenbacteria bacterium]|uniref:Uncharacterized protein n=1 Tax=Eiseniibacteriota bacterium TaxID=2212470 RepID=A0A956LZR6_UNCEI|nr:hypothetical protein [Candidatus Eisenbacteria bacterium]